MTAREYLQQGYRLDKRISRDIAESTRLRNMALSIRSSSFEEHYNPNRPDNASFVHCLEQVWEMEQRVNEEIERLVMLKEQIRTVINEVSNPDEQSVLSYRYIHNLTWKQIGTELNANEKTVRRWHDKAIRHIVVPKDYIEI